MVKETILDWADRLEWKVKDEDEFVKYVRNNYCVNDDYILNRFRELYEIDYNLPDEIFDKEYVIMWMNDEFEEIDRDLFYNLYINNYLMEIDKEIFVNKNLIEVE